MQVKRKHFYFFTYLQCVAHLVNICGYNKDSTKIISTFSSLALECQIIFFTWASHCYALLNDNEMMNKLSGFCGKSSSILNKNIEW
jgi:hypothetical protein